MRGETQVCSLTAAGERHRSPRATLVIAPTMAIRALLLEVRESHTPLGFAPDSHWHKHAAADPCETLEDFVEAIERDQAERLPDIPPALATPWSQAAISIKVSLGCNSDGASPAGVEREAANLR
jgi:hypothetical protein